MPTGIGNKKFNGGIDGHSDKWADKHRPKNSFNAGAGNRASRNQGLGAQGKQNAQASQGIDTTKMSPDEKMRYFKSLGLMPTGSTESSPEDKKEFSAKAELTGDFVQDMKSTFNQKPMLLKQLFDALNELPVHKKKRAQGAVYQEIKDMLGSDPDLIFKSAMSVLDEFYE